jgi:conserved oligomeric Golgi complex subunit 8
VWSGGQQTERFLKRYIEIFREQSFAIVSLYKNIFAPAPSESFLASSSMRGLDLRRLSLQTGQTPENQTVSESSLPPALATFPMHLAQLLIDTLRAYLPNVKDKASRESLLTQVLYCAASLGRLGGDFSMMLSLLGEGDEQDGLLEEDTMFEWEEVMKKHRVLAERLDLLTKSGGLGGSNTA